MLRFFTMFHFFISAYSTKISAYNLPSLTINGSKGPFKLIGENTPKHSFIVSSFTNEPKILIKDSKWIRDYEDYSIVNYIQGNHSLLVEPSSSDENLDLFVTLCSFDEEISEDVKVLVEYSYSEQYCSKGGYLVGGKCKCFDGFAGDDCSLGLIDLNQNSSYWGKVEPFELMFFSITVEDEEFNVEINSKSENLQSFFWTSFNKTEIRLPSFLNLDNDLEYLKGSTTISLKSASSQEIKVFFSIFCFTDQPCEVTITLNSISNNENKGNSSSRILLIAVLSITIPIFISILGLIMLKFSNSSNPAKKNKGLSGDSINTYADIIYVDEDMQNEECAICYENYAEYVEAKKVACGHVFHTECIDQWALINAHCPLCRVDFNRCLSSR